MSHNPQGSGGTPPTTTPRQRRGIKLKPADPVPAPEPAKPDPADDPEVMRRTWTDLAEMAADQLAKLDRTGEQEGGSWLARRLEQEAARAKAGETTEGEQ